ncbi:hypothetical protein BDA96_01G070200 [Sorghum bicolor]|uniref:Adaptor AP-1 19 kDa protein n=8 Tax=Poaceae TaxID=4479 RepID=A0A921UWD8_SORBI|nr:hypothetical protein BDA96_01G070200 [Sorghum bicolor]
MGFYLVVHQTNAPPAPSADAHLPRSARLGPKDRIFRAWWRLPLGGVQRRRGSPRLGGGVRRLPPPSLASRLAPSPASSTNRPTTLRTHLPLPSRRCCSRGSPASCPGWPGLGSAGAVSYLRPDLTSVTRLCSAHAGSRSCYGGSCPSAMINFVLLISRQGKVRLTKWYSPYTQKERTKVIRELSGLILTRGPKLCNFVEWRGYKVVYRRYASLYFCMCIDADDNELEVLEIIHHFVEILDRYFGSVCELDLIFNFHKAYYILDEILIAGELQESSKKNVARLIAAQDSLVEAAKEEASSISNIIAQATK